MRFKDNKLIWEQYMGSNQIQGAGEKHSSFPLNKNLMYDDIIDSSEEEEGPEIIIGFEPEEPIEVDTEHEEMETPEDENKEHGEEIDEILYSDIKKLATYSKGLLCPCKQAQMSSWMKAKLIKASDYVTDVWNCLDAKADFANDEYEQSENIDL